MHIGGDRYTDIDGVDVVTKELLDLFSLHRIMYDHRIAFLPVGRGHYLRPQSSANLLTRRKGEGTYLVFVTELEGIDDPQDLGEVPAGRSWVGEGEADRFLGVDDEDGPHGKGHTFLPLL